MDKNIFRNLSYGVYVVTTMDGMRQTGCVANSCMQITSDPAVVAVSINHDNYTNKCIKESKSLAVNILTENADMTLIGNFGFQSGKDVNKFENIPFEWAYGNPVLKDSTCGYFAGDVIGSYETGTHTVFFVEIKDAEVKSGTPMTYAYYHKVKNGKSPKMRRRICRKKRMKKKHPAKNGYAPYADIFIREIFHLRSFPRTLYVLCANSPNLYLNKNKKSGLAKEK